MHSKTAFLLTTASLAALLAGCAAPPPATEAMLTYESNPAGAKIYQGSTLLGAAPLTQTYKSDGRPTIRTPDVTAVWVSGAKISFWTELKPGADEVATLTRPTTAPNLQADLAEAARVVAENKQAYDRIKDQQLRDQKRNSAGCQEALARNNMAAASSACY
ncbi:MAG TPA: hypothetical protein VGM81_06135 [Burkholderiaceae bacterium]|jgi:hypothetical protein